MANKPDVLPDSAAPRSGKKVFLHFSGAATRSSVWKQPVTEWREKKLSGISLLLISYANSVSANISDKRNLKEKKVGSCFHP